MHTPPISHPATIKTVADGKITLEIAAQQSCGSCAAKKVCGSGETKTLVLEDDGMGRQSGDQVTLVITRSMGVFAIAIAYLIPIFLIISALLIFQYFALPEITSAWITLAILVAYFVVLRLMRQKIQNQLTITIE